MTDAFAEFTAKQAEREAGPILAMFEGESGSGKTYSALLFARGLVGPTGKIGVIDTEGRRALIYADDQAIGGFEHIDFRPPYSSDRFRLAVNAAVAQGWKAIVIDSASHEHEAEGGMLEFADQEEASGRGRAFGAKWIRPKIAHTRFLAAAKSAPAHVIFCVRLKRLVDLAESDPRKRKVILETVCEKNMPFEMMIRVRLDDKHQAQFLKVPKPFLAHIREGEVITPHHGELLMHEAGKGRVEDPAVAKARAELEDAARNDGLITLRVLWERKLDDGGYSAELKKKLAPEMPRIKELAAATDKRHEAEARATEEARRSGAAAKEIRDDPKKDEWLPGDD